MIGRFLRAYPGYMADQVLETPVQRFWSLYLAIPALEAADDLRALMVAGHGANVGKRGENFASMAKTLKAQADGNAAAPGRPASQPAGRAIVPGLTVGVTGAEPGSLRAARLAKLAELREAERDRGR